MNRVENEPKQVAITGQEVQPHLESGPDGGKRLRDELQRLLRGDGEEYEPPVAETLLRRRR